MIETTACIVGGGPAGMMLGWLLARAGVEVCVLEKHADFFRDFRGDTIHPSTMDLMHELGVIDAFLRVPHSKLRTLDVQILGETVPGPDLSHLPTHEKYIAMMPQWDFLAFVREQASKLPTFRLELRAEVTELVRDGDRIAGVKLRDGREVRARLVVGCDGRHSTVRECAALRVRDLGAPIDVLWFRIPRDPKDAAPAFAVAEPSAFVVRLDRGDYWQCAFVIGKGGFDALRAERIEKFRARLRPLLPHGADALASWDDVKLLTVTLDRLETWAVPGLLCIGDAAHAMSPVGGVGINLAIQDAVAAANLLWSPLLVGTPGLAELLAVQKRRESAAARVQSLQARVHRSVLGKVVTGRAERALRIARFVLKRVPFVRRVAARIVAVGFTPEHVQSPAAR
ncbi:MAG TPA: FAD-dependent oxidoreductase [Kofleriaceae bacterium]|jgi:2-polyprenyl-6-methoxyphenol hydroxylase-like FAD-dependent oxidoreductase